MDLPPLPPAVVVELPPGLVNSNTGVFLCDVAALVTMAACVPTLGLYYRRRRWGDLATFGLGFILACVYHICQMDADGLAAASVLGVPGPVWRTWDILCAQWLLGRAFGHFIGAKHPATVALTNAAFPAAVALAARSAAAAGTAFNLLTCAQSLLGVLAAATAAKLGLEGAHSLPDLGAGRVRKAAACIGAGVAVFPLPERWPGAYWACHSAWHLLMGAGLHELYLALEGEPPARIGAGVAAAVAGVAAAPGRAARAVWGGGAGPAPAAAGAPHALAGAGGAKAGGGRAGGGAVRHHLHAWAASGRLMMGGGAGAGGLLPAAPPPPPAAGAGAGAALEGWVGAAAGLAASSLRAVAAAAGLSSSDGSDADGSRRSSGERSAKPGRRRSVRQAAAAARR